MWTSIESSNEYPLILLFCILFVVVMVFWGISLVIKTIDVINRKKERKLFEQFLETEIMSMNGEEIWKQALNGTVPTQSGNGNEKHQIGMLSNYMSMLNKQAGGLVAKMGHLAMAQAAQEQLKLNHQIGQAIDGHIAQAEGTFQEVAPVMIAAALGNTQAEAEEVVVPEVGSAENLHQAGIDHLVHATASAEVVPDEEFFVKQYIAEKMKQIHNQLNLIKIDATKPESYNLSDIPKSTLGVLVAQLRTTCCNPDNVSKEDNKAFHFLSGLLQK